jgi:tRNA threonylcarbamoyladenosine biosynthesis protein TsaE
VQIESSSPEETEAVAAALAAVLRPGDVVTVSGELGAGKTTFVRGACRALGITQPVTSPTFTIGHRYDGVAHLDLYRFAGVSAAEWGGPRAVLRRHDRVRRVAEAGETALPEPRFRVRMRHIDEAHRMIELESTEPTLLQEL